MLVADIMIGRIFRCCSL